jgi:adenosyl cobinamide kinase/adenosyl cobinamide phosphate guanylyltransferase
MPLVLVTGGASSGKSDFALTLLKDREDVLFIATGVATDGEMAAKIERHRRNRPASWETLEEPTDIVGALGRLGESRADLIIDDLTFWVSNLLFGEGMTPGEVLSEAERAAKILEGRAGESIVVTNEIGMGIVPPEEATRSFRVAAGDVNRIFAAHAYQVHLVVSGVPVTIKGGRP